MPLNNIMTEKFLRSAYGGESMAHMRYLIWGEIAEKENLPNIARLFRAIAYAEWAHANNQFRELKDKKGSFSVSAGAVFVVGKTVENLQGAIDGELHEAQQLYPVYLQTARFQNEKGAERAFHFALEAEKIHARLFQEAKTAAEQGKDMELGTVYVCPICGHTHVGTIPGKCPVCGVTEDKYKTFPA
ncbi:Rubrerythrin-2 [Vulcanibacillus modesticaldus]|uniref:Rubrerythrin-2 n=1 Tax=Vulcanibacillus modesticaldus TaxID=337097 RepID=A0A1D2YTD1_9BACI|nr:rubrerythrin family protein [Vulcanibacillus modesticaldus]OEF98940.1 Rubrerythrin-2 [Vulcanibacillus modesticaldus]